MTDQPGGGKVSGLTEKIPRPPEALIEWLSIAARTLVVAALIGAFVWARQMDSSIADLKADQVTRSDMFEIERRLDRIESSRFTVEDGASIIQQFNSHLIDQAALDTLQTAQSDAMQQDIDELKQLIRDAVAQMRRYHGGAQ